MIELITVKILQKFNHKEEISKDLLQQKINQDNVLQPLLTVINLMTEGDISNYSLYQIKDYLSDLLTKADITEEYEWALLYLLIKATKTNLEYADTIFTLYKSLPKLSDSSYYLWLQYETKLAIIPYLIYLDQDISPLLQELQNTSNEIKSYNQS